MGADWRLEQIFGSLWVRAARSVGAHRLPGKWNLMGSSSSWNRPGIPTPDRDVFYASPAGLDEVAHGAVLRSRPVQVSFFGRFRHGAAVQLMYRSTDAHGRPEAAVTTVVVPRGKDPANLSGAVLPVRHRRSSGAVLSVLRTASGCRVGRGLRSGGVPFHHRGPVPRVGGQHSRSRGPQGHVGRTVRGGLPCSRRSTRRCQLRGVRPVTERPDGDVGVFRGRSGQRMGRRSRRDLCT